MHRKVYAACIVLIALGACRAGLPRPPYAEQTSADLKQVPFPPPPARVEFVPDEPSSDAVWIDGEWEWFGRAWAWKRGRWVVPPAEAAFSPWTTVRGADGMLYLAPGTWRAVTSGKAITAPTAIAYGKPTAGALVDSEGVSEHTGKSIKEDKSDDDSSKIDAGTKAEQKAEKKAEKVEQNAEKKSQKVNETVDEKAQDTE